MLCRCDNLVFGYFPPVVMLVLYRQRPQSWMEELTQLPGMALADKPLAILE